jgi:hypothetical protein
MKHFTKHILVLALALAGGFGYAGAEEKTITIRYDSTFEPALPTASGSENTSATAHTVNGLSIKEAGIYKGSSANYLMSFATGTIIWSEDFTNYNAGDVPASGTYATYKIANGGSQTKIYNETNAGGTSPELFISNTKNGKSGSMTATINLRRYYGNMTLVFKPFLSRFQRGQQNLY